MASRDFILDTHTFLWFQANDPHLSVTARRVIEDRNNRIFVSAVVCWEITTKYQLGKLLVLPDVANDVERAVLRSGLNALPITFPHAQKTGSLPYHHKDPFDRLLIAQAMVKGMTLVSNEELFDRYGRSPHLVDGAHSPQAGRISSTDTIRGLQ